MTDCPPASSSSPSVYLYLFLTLFFTSRWKHCFHSHAKWSLAGRALSFDLGPTSQSASKPSLLSPSFPEQPSLVFRLMNRNETEWNQERQERTWLGRFGGGISRSIASSTNHYVILCSSSIYHQHAFIHHHQTMAQLHHPHSHGVKRTIISGAWAWEGASARRLREMPLCAAFDITFHSLFPWIHVWPGSGIFMALNQVSIKGRSFSTVNPTSMAG